MSRDSRINALVSSGHGLSHFYQLCLPPLFVVWQHAFGVDYAALGLAATMMSGITAVLQTPLGFLVDRYGPRLILIGGTAIMGLSIAALALAQSYWEILVLCLLSGIGNSVFHPVDYTIMNHAIAPERVGRAFGWHIFGGNIGYTVSPIIMTALILSLGWRMGVLVAGLFCVPFVIMQIWQNRFLAIKPVVEETVDTAVETNSLRLLVSRTMIFLLLFYAVATIATAGLQTWLITLLHTEHGLVLSLAAWGLTSFTGGVSVGVLFGGWLTSRTHRLLLVQALTLMPAAVLVALIVLPLPVATLFPLIFVLGMLSGTMRAPRDLITKYCAPPGQVGKVFGLVTTGLPLGSAISPVVFGFLIDHHVPYLIFDLASVLFLLTFAMAILATSGGRAIRAVQAAE